MHKISIIALTGPARSGLKILSTCLKILGFSACNHTQQSPETIDSLLLQDLGCAPGPLPSGWSDSEASKNARNRIDKFLSQAGTLSDKPLQATLNPHTLPLWLDTFKSREISLKLVHIIRHPYEVALSLQAHQGLDLTRGHILWLSCIRAGLKAIENIRIQCSNSEHNSELSLPALITFDQLLADPVTTCNSFLAPSPSHLVPEAIASLLDFVQPGLKNHHASDLPEPDKKMFAPYAKLYDQLRSALHSASAQISDNQPAQLNRLVKTSPKGIQQGRIKNFSAFSCPDLIDTLLQALNQNDPQITDNRPSPLTNNKYQITGLYAQITFPSSHNESGITHTISLIEDQWQKMSLPIPESGILKDSPIIIKPLNVFGTIKISSIRIENKSTGKLLRKIQSPQDFDSLTINDDLYRLVDLEKLVLLAIGPNPILTLPLLRDLPDAQLELSLWMKGNKSLHTLHNTFKLNTTRPHKGNSSNLVWLASYPRSGNTWLRIVLRHNFGLKSYSVYNDTGDIGKYIEISETVGHQYMHWESVTGVKKLDAHSDEQFNSFDSLRYKTSDLKLVKTHSQFHEGFLPDKVVYIYRDGRSALRSFASYLHDFSNRSKELNKLLDELLCGCDTFTSPWSRHILSWKETSHDKVLFLKFEDVLSDINLALKKIAAFLEIQPVRTDVLTFEELHAINPDFFRKGQKKSWHDLFDDTRHALFWLLNHEAMDLLGFDQDKHLICEALFHNKEAEEKAAPVSASQLDYFNHILQYCGSIILAHISSIPDRNRQFMHTSLQNAHDKLAAYFSHWDAQGEYCAWIKDWEQIFTEFDNNEQE